MNDWQKMVQELHTAWRLPVGDYARPSNMPTQLDADLLEEEFRELMDSMFENEGFDEDEWRPKRRGDEPVLAEVAKEMADLIIVVLGRAVSLGIDLDGVFKAVHASNMTKIAPDGKVLRNADGKVLKGPNYVPPNIERELENQVAWAEFQGRKP